MGRKKQEKRYVYISDKYRFYIDHTAMALECKTGEKWVNVGFFNKLEHLMKRIVRLEADKQIGNTSIGEYIKILQAENEKIQATFKALGIE